jgi:hypothetical protein
LTVKDWVLALDGEPTTKWARVGAFHGDGMLVVQRSADLAVIAQPGVRLALTRRSISARCAGGATLHA